MIDVKQIKPNMSVVGSDKKEFSVVEAMEGTNSIKLKQDAKGQSHYIPFSWVASIDDKIHLNRTSEKATAEQSDKATGEMSSKSIGEPSSKTEQPLKANAEQKRSV